MLNNNWVGDDIRSYMKVKTPLYKNINMGIAIEKDRGEK